MLLFDRRLAKKAADNLKAVREKRPLIHNITNYVVMNYTANALLACGAAPVMAHALEEVEEMVSLAKALVINIGTLSNPWIESMIKAGKRANQLNVPIILDPVGSGATTLRTMTSRKLVEEITPMKEDFAQWYTDIVLKAGLVDYSAVRGCMVIRPYGYAIWELIQKGLDLRFKETGHENVYMPMFIPESY